MTYVALLRGVNVGGKSLVSMADLKTCFESLGLANVKTYINSGNIIFQSPNHNTKALRQQLEKAIHRELGLPVMVLIRNLPNIENLVKKLPNKWVTDREMRCDVMFLDEAVDRPGIVKDFPPMNAEHEDLRYISGAVVWRVDRIYVRKSKLPRIIGTNLYKQQTARNTNTVRKLHAMMTELDAA